MKWILRFFFRPKNLLFISLSGGGQGGRSPGEQGAGEGGKLENRGQEAGAEINMVIVCCNILLGIIQSKTPIKQGFEISN